jgi:hypothetical protein
MKPMIRKYHRHISEFCTLTEAVNLIIQDEIKCRNGVHRLWPKYKYCSLCKCIPTSLLGWNESDD